MVVNSNVNVEELLPCATTVLCQCSCQIERYYESQTCTQIAKFCIITDLWTHEKTNLKCSTATAHYSEKEWNTVSAILVT